MQVFFYIAFLIAIGVTIFAIQNSSAPPIMIKFLVWRFETSLVYTILGSVVLGILLSFFFWASRTIHGSFQKKKLQKEENDLNGTDFNTEDDH
jgi:uncharacterized integral membrane protein